jgi:hypothetical protein
LKQYFLNFADLKVNFDFFDYYFAFSAYLVQKQVFFMSLVSRFYNSKAVFITYKFLQIGTRYERVIIKRRRKKRKKVIKIYSFLDKFLKFPIKT